MFYTPIHWLDFAVQPQRQDRVKPSEKAQKTPQSGRFITARCPPLCHLVTHARDVMQCEEAGRLAALQHILGFAELAQIGNV